MKELQHVAAASTHSQLAILLTAEGWSPKRVLRRPPILLSIILTHCTSQLYSTEPGLTTANPGVAVPVAGLPYSDIGDGAPCNCCPDPRMPGGGRGRCPAGV